MKHLTSTFKPHKAGLGRVLGDLEKTVMDRLLKKGLIRRAKRGRLFVYTAAMSKDDFVKQVSHEVLQGIMDISASSAASSFVDILYKTSPQEVERLSRLIEERKRGRSRK